MKSVDGLFGCKVALSYRGEVMLYGREHVLLELTMLFDAVVLQLFFPWLFRFRAQPKKMFLWAYFKLP